MWQQETLGLAALSVSRPFVFMASVKVEEENTFEVLARVLSHSVP